MNNNCTTDAHGRNTNPFWKCGSCGTTFQETKAPEVCPSCKQNCDFSDVTCYSPDCGGPGNIDPRLV